MRRCAQSHAAVTGWEGIPRGDWLREGVGVPKKRVDAEVLKNALGDAQIKPYYRCQGTGGVSSLSRARKECYHSKVRPKFSLCLSTEPTVVFNESSDARHSHD